MLTPLLLTQTPNLCEVWGRGGEGGVEEEGGGGVTTSPPPSFSIYLKDFFFYLFLPFFFNFLDFFHFFCCVRFLHSVYYFLNLFFKLLLDLRRTPAQDPPPQDRPPPDRPTFSVFVPSPAPIFALFLSLWGSSRGILVVFESRDPQMRTFVVLGLSCGIFTNLRTPVVVSAVLFASNWWFPVR